MDEIKVCGAHARTADAWQKKNEENDERKPQWQIHKDIQSSVRMSIARI